MSHVALRPAVRYWFYQPYTGHFLSGNLSAALYDVGTEKSYRRGWMDEAKRYYETACQMDPGNLEYQRALDYMENGPRQAYTPGGTTLPPKTSGYTAPAGSLSAPRNAR